MEQNEQNQKFISIMIPCYNEHDNILLIYKKIQQVFEKLNYQYEIIFADNCSSDGSQSLLRTLAKQDKRIKVILNNRNYGVERSCTNAFMLCTGDAVIQIACDLQDPPELIPKFLHYWEQGYELVLGQKQTTRDKFLTKTCRNIYYKVMSHLSENGHVPNVTGYGLYDKKVMDMLRWMSDPLPYTRGIICDLGYKMKLVPYDKTNRKSGKSSYNMSRYIDTAVWGMVSASRKPIKYIRMLSIILALIAIFLFFIGIIFNETLQIILLISSIITFSCAIVTFCIYILAEYISIILTKVTKRPMTVSEEMINIDLKETETTLYGH